MYNHNKAQQNKNRVHISWDILYDMYCNPHIHGIFVSLNIFPFDRNSDKNSNYIHIFP